MPGKRAIGALPEARERRRREAARRVDVQVWPKDDGVGTLADDAVFTDAGVTVREAKDLWDMPVVFLTLALLLGAEWGYRRWRGLA